MTDATVRRERFLPHAYDRSSLVFDVVGCTRDDEPVLIGETREIELIGDWHRAELTVRAAVGSAARERLVPASERRDPPLAVLVALRCEATRLRRGDVLPLSGDEATGTLVLRHGELADRAELLAWLVRTKPIPGTGARRAAGYATSAGSRVANAAPWSIAVERERARSARGFDVQFKAFSADPAIPQEQRNNLYRLECAQDAPVLWLNADLSEVADVLRAEGTRGHRARLRDVAFDRIVTAVRAQLVMHAAAHAIGDGPVYEWERTVLADALPRLFPNAAAADRLERLRASLHEPGDLLARLDDVLQAHERTGDSIRKLVEDS